MVRSALALAAGKRPVGLGVDKKLVIEDDATAATFGLVNWAWKAMTVRCEAAPGRVRGWASAPQV